MLKRHRQIIVSNVDELVQNTNFPNFVREIVFHKVFTQDMVNRILVIFFVNNEICRVIC